MSKAQNRVEFYRLWMNIDKKTELISLDIVLLFLKLIHFQCQLKLLVVEGLRIVNIDGLLLFREEFQDMARN